MILSEGMETVLSSFRHLFTTPTWGDVQILLIGAILCRGKRTVTAVLRTMGLKHEPHFTNFHRVLNRNRWSPLSASRLRFHLLLDLLPSSQSVVIGIDETLERRKGKRGRKPEKGVRLPHLATIANNPHQPGETKEIHWYGESQRLVRIIEYYVMRWNGEVTFEE